MINTKEKDKALEHLPQKIYNILEDMYNTLERLYSVLVYQKKCLIKWDQAEFMKTIKEQEILTRENTGRERDRLALFGEIAIDNEEAATMSIGEMAEHFLPPWPEKFKELSIRIKNAGNKVNLIRKQNERHIEQSRDLVTDQIRLIMEFNRMNRDVYGKSGKKNPSTNVYKVVDRKY